MFIWLIWLTKRVTCKSVNWLIVHWNSYMPSYLQMYTEQFYLSGIYLQPSSESILVSVFDLEVKNYDVWMLNQYSLNIISHLPTFANLSGYNWHLYHHNDELMKIYEYKTITNRIKRLYREYCYMVVICYQNVTGISM